MYVHTVDFGMILPKSFTAGDLKCIITINNRPPFILALSVGEGSINDILPESSRTATMMHRCGIYDPRGKLNLPLSVLLWR